MLPNALKVPICYDRTTLALYRGGYADVWKGEYRGQDVAVKVIRTYKNSDLKKILGVSGWLFLIFAVAGLTVFSEEILQGGRNVENPPTSKCPIAGRSDHVGSSVRNGIRLDAEWEHQRIREDEPGCQTVEIGRFIVPNLISFISNSLTTG